MKVFFTLQFCLLICFGCVIFAQDDKKFDRAAEIAVIMPSATQPSQYVLLGSMAQCSQEASVSGYMLKCIAKNNYSLISRGDQSKLAAIILGQTEQKQIAEIYENLYLIAEDYQLKPTGVVSTCSKLTKNTVTENISIN